MVPDIERVLSDYLRTYPAVASLGARIVGKTPGEDHRDTQWVRVTRLSGDPAPGDPADHAIGFLVQFDCYAGDTGGQPESNLLGRTVREALKNVALYTHADAVVTGSRITGDARIPDTDFEDARDRTILTATVWAHAVPS